MWTVVLVHHIVVYISVSDSYFTRNHGIGDYPSLVISRLKWPTGSMYADNVGMTIVMCKHKPFSNELNSMQCPAVLR